MEPTFPPEQTRVSGRRYLAHVADGVVVSLGFVVLAVPAALVSDLLLGIVVVIWLTVGPILYFVLVQRGTGRSPGKRLAGLQVVDAGGAPPDTAALVKRSLPLLLEYFYVIAWISMMASPYRQRFGDRWGRTYVVRV